MDSIERSYDLDGEPNFIPLPDENKREPRIRFLDGRPERESNPHEIDKEPDFPEFLEGEGPDEKMRSRGYNDLFHAYKILELYGDSIRYCKKMGGFFVWDRKRWIKDENGAMWRMARQTAWQVYADSLELDINKRSSLMVWSKRAERSSRIAAALKQLKAMEEIAVEPEQFDADPWLLTVNNGTIDLRNGLLREHRRGDLITRLAPVAYDPKCPSSERWQTFLSEIFGEDEELIGFVRRACGYALTGSVVEKKVFFLHGEDGSGKTTFLETLMHVMGGYSRRMPPNLLTSPRQGLRPYVFAELRGCRLAGVVQMESGDDLSGMIIRELTGGGRLVGHRGGANYIKFDPSQKLFACCDRPPWTRRRILAIPFAEIVPEEHQDKDLPEKLRDEAAGILNWMVKGCLEWRKRGLNPPVDVAQSPDVYRDDTDVLDKFIYDWCEHDSDSMTPNPELRKAYEQWCEWNGKRPMSARGLTLCLKKKGYVQNQIGPSRTRTWMGIDLLPEDERDTEEYYRELREMDE